MNQMQIEMMGMRRELEALSRKDLQALAKQEGIRANGKSADIIDTMLRLAFPDLLSAGTKHHTIPAANSQQTDVAGDFATGLAGQSSTRRSSATAAGGLPVGGSSKGSVMPVDVGNELTKDQVVYVPDKQPIVQQAGGRGIGTGRKTWEASRQEQLAATHLEPRMQKLCLSPPKAVVHKPIDSVAVPSATSRPAATAQQQHGQGRAAVVKAAGIPFRDQSPTRVGISAHSSSSSPGKAVAATQDQERHKRIAVAGGKATIKAHAATTQAMHTAAPVKEHPQQQQQQQKGDPPPTPGHVLHTPLRVRAVDSAAAAQAAGRAAGPGQLAGSAVAQARSTAAAGPARSAAVTPPRRNALTPPRQQVKAFGESCAAAGARAVTPVRAGRPVTPIRAAGAQHSSRQAAATSAAGLMSPRMAAMGSARRVVPTQARTAGSSAPVASSSASSSTVAAGAAASAAAAGPPPTPLQKPARRTVDDRQVDEGDKQLEALVERCLRIVNPDAPQTVMHGPEPAKRWLQQNIIAPLKRAAPSIAPAAAGQAAATAPVPRSSSSNSTCFTAGYCYRSLLLYGPSGCGKTELVHALAREMGANLLYVPAGDLLKSCQDQGQKLLRALMRVARRVSPCVLCFDDAHRSFPAETRSPQQQKLLVELAVQMQQLADMQVQLQDKSQQQSQQKHGSSSSSGASELMSPSKGKRPAWGMFGGKKAEQQGQQQPQQSVAKQPQPAYATLGGPIVVVFSTRHPEALDLGLLQLLQCRLFFDLPSAETREDMLLNWLMEKDAAVGVQDVDRLVRDTDGFSCSDLLQLCHEAAMRPVQERARRAVCMKDFEAAFLKVAPSITPQRRTQLQAWR